MLPGFLSRHVSYSPVAKHPVIAACATGAVVGSLSAVWLAKKLETAYMRSTSGDSGDHDD